ncbi:MAG: polyvinylalcohol dehydrogenase [Verrucomicrobiales bacterium]|nr:polyvinylalcohol dehydrogenase [Verrucomicrobiales bacterium]|tara:strand:+ start:23428 stop:24642 length:1215 start_codon:yes stop_codon:yes gene_type:complete
MNRALAFSLTTLFSLQILAIDWPQWRGPNRDGVNTEANLLDEWPENGPKLLWRTEGLGAGFSSVSVAKGRIFTMGDGKTASHVFCLSEKNGGLFWTSKPVGKTGGNYKGTRSTPTVVEGLVYALGQFGDLVCLKAETGVEVWRRSLTKDFGGRSGGWNYTESPLVDGDKVIVTPGGGKGAAVALNRMNGELIWQSRDFTDGAQYSSFIVREFGGERQYIQLTGANVVSLSAKTGKVLWKAPRRGRTATVSTPIFHEGRVFVSSSYGVGCNGFKVTYDGTSFSTEQTYANKTISNHHGGCIRVGGYVYGSSGGTLACMDLVTGEEMWRERSAGKGAIVVADGKIILRAEKGPVSLVELNPKAYKEISRFDQPDRTRANAWSHPVVSNGVLYLKDQGLLLAYDLRK